MCVGVFIVLLLCVSTVLLVHVSNSVFVALFVCMCVNYSITVSAILRYVVTDIKRVMADPQVKDSAEQRASFMCYIEKRNYYMIFIKNNMQPNKQINKTFVR